MAKTTIEIQAWALQDALLEVYNYLPGPAGAIPRHFHQEYHFCLSLNCPGEYYYRRAYHVVPVGSLSVIHPDEIHSAQDVSDRPANATFQMLYIPPTLMQSLSADIGNPDGYYPFFATPIILNPELANRFQELHRAVAAGDSQLEQDGRLLFLLEQLIQRYADIRPSLQPIGQETERIQQIREYLAENLTENVSLAQLAEIANLSPHHLNRVFSQTVGIPPHRYQIQLRVDRAKHLLLQGLQLRDVAEQAGFSDQNHLARHFKQLLGVTPGQYRV